MRRRAFVAAFVGASLPVMASAQQTNRERRVGMLMHVTENDTEERVRLGVFVERLKELGWAENQSGWSNTIP
jgi:putative ABC transport system substrate-binding protein